MKFSTVLVLAALAMASTLAAETPAPAASSKAPAAAGETPAASSKAPEGAAPGGAAAPGEHKGSMAGSMHAEVPAGDKKPADDSTGSMKDSGMTSTTAGSSSGKSPVPSKATTPVPSKTTSSASTMAAGSVAATTAVVITYLL